MPVDVPIKDRGQNKRPSRFTFSRKSTAKLGYRIGGVCDQIHRARRKRERGALDMVDLLFQQKKRCLEEEGSKFRVINYPKWDWREYCRLRGGDSEIGMHRFSQIVIPKLIEQKMLVTRTFLEKIAKQIAAFEFGVAVDNPLSILEGTAKFGLAKPHQDHLYQQRVKENDI